MMEELTDPASKGKGAAEFFGSGVGSKSFGKVGVLALMNFHEFHTHVSLSLYVYMYMIGSMRFLNEIVLVTIGS